jgi:transposase
MRFVAVKTKEQQARAMLFRTWDLHVPQRTQLINALRGHLSEHLEHAPDFRAAGTATRPGLRQSADGVEIVGAI